VLLCDRGTADGAAYWPDGDDSFFAAIGSSHEAELARYDAVLFFETAAMDAVIEGGNRCRTETNEQACAPCRRGPLIAPLARAVCGSFTR
jgi:hypothetical protein